MDSFERGETWRYAALGLHVESEFPLPLQEVSSYREAESFRVTVAADHPTFDLEPAEMVAQLRHSTGGYDIHRMGSRYFARFPAHGWLCIDVEEHRLEVSAASPALAHIAGNLGLAIYLVARGSCVIHAAAFLWQGQVHAIVGGSRSGKSTLTALLSAAGASVVSDDTLRVVFDTPITCAGSSTAIRLRPSASDVVQLVDATVETSVDGRRVFSGSSVASGGSLTSLWFVRPDPKNAEPVLVELPRAGSFQRLIDGVRIRGLSDRFLMQRQLQHLAVLSSAVPAFEARLPWGPPFHREWAHRLLDNIERRCSSVGPRE